MVESSSSSTSSHNGSGLRTPAFPSHLRSMSSHVAMTRLSNLAAVTVYSDGGSKSDLNTVNSSVVFNTRVGSDSSITSSRYDDYEGSLHRNVTTASRVNPRGQEIYRRSQEQLYGHRQTGPASAANSSITTSINYRPPSTIPELKEIDRQRSQVSVSVAGSRSTHRSEMVSVQRSVGATTSSSLTHASSLRRSNATKRKIGWLSAIFSSKLRLKRFVQRFKKGFARNILRRKSKKAKKSKTKKRPTITRIDDWYTPDLHTYETIKQVHEKQKDINRSRSMRSTVTQNAAPQQQTPKPEKSQQPMAPIVEEPNLSYGSRMDDYLSAEEAKVVNRYDSDIDNFSKTFYRSSFELEPTAVLPIESSNPNSPQMHVKPKFSKNEELNRVFELWKHYLGLVVSNRIEMKLEIAKIAQGDSEKQQNQNARRQSVLESILSDYDEESSVFSGADSENIGAQSIAMSDGTSAASQESFDRYKKAPESLAGASRHPGVAAYVSV
ncbi:unnamed protein product [Kuraishia capsulata CBS 1993]|uniref:Altered inheritance of mitochondria protein 44 n=1 Tax=Kuraishia capsulata CBS 1993 TaxID=1382522 RepID=W6MT49_9ASCO|nr:uncharacterized protein KUCA_T00005991001 [Kuraishia capsulata CBS 1993]CDK29996.1 unnamed protein product [Kuraishia capsulata CBS 1993]